MNRFIASFAGLLAVLCAGRALADCAASVTVKDVTRAHADGRKLEKSGNLSGALDAYVQAQEYTCDANPIASEAARRAAALGKQLGDRAHRQGDFESAYSAYERGGHYLAADQALSSLIQAQPDSVTLYERAHEHVSGRSIESFSDNNAGRLTLTGPYRLDPKLVERVNAMPGQALLRALQAEQAAFDETFLARHVALIRERPVDPADAEGLAAWRNKYIAFRQQYPEAPMQQAVRSLDLARQWVNADRRNADPAPQLRRIAQRAQTRVTQLTQKYAAAPDLLGTAIEYLTRCAHDPREFAARKAAIQAQADALGDRALRQSSYQLAVEYYGIADAEEKAAQAHQQMQAAVQARTQPALDAARSDAEAIAARLASPDNAAEMQRHAQEARRALQQGASARNTPGAKRAKADLAKDLGL